MEDYAIMAEEWLAQGNPFDLEIIEAWDFDGNGLSDNDDFLIMSDAWLSREGDDNWNGACDISMPADGVIDYVDYAIFSSHWGE